MDRIGNTDGEPAPQSHTLVPELDDLLEELRRRAGAARRGHEQLEALLDAVLAISADLQLPEMLRRVVASACSLVDARYGALGVLGPDKKQLVEFITHGVTDEERERIGDLPRGRGLLGLLIREPHHLRIPEIASHPDSFGFPPNHPPMTSFLGAPIRIRDEVYGNIYLTEKQNGQEFSSEDESVIAALAAAAGVALQNAQLYEQRELQREWAAAVSDVAQALLENDHEAAGQRVIAHRVCDVAGSSACIVALDREDSTPVVTAVHSSRHPAAAREGGTRLGALGIPLSDEWTAALAAQRTLLLIPDDSGKTPDSITEDARQLAGLPSQGPTAVVPITAGRSTIGVLVPVWRPGDNDVASGLLDQLAEFGRQVGVALVASRAQSDRAQLLLLEDRERIARDMHDLVIQRLFAVGLSLQFASPMAQHPTVHTRLEEAIIELDDTIKDIRQVIYQLHIMAKPTGVAERVAELVDGYSQTLGFGVQLDIGDPVVLEPGMEMDVLAVIREGLANVARHAHASSASVTLRLGSPVLVRIDDDGVGIGEVTHHSGLANMVERAKSRSGHCEIMPREPSGTRIEWKVPADEDRQGPSRHA